LAIGARFWFEITIETDTGTIHTAVDDLHERAAPLVKYLQQHARPMPLE